MVLVGDNHPGIRYDHDKRPFFAADKMPPVPLLLVYYFQLHMVMLWCMTSK